MDDRMRMLERLAPTNQDAADALDRMKERMGEMTLTQRLMASAWMWTYWWDGNIPSRVTPAAHQSQCRDRQCATRPGREHRIGCMMPGYHEWFLEHTAEGTREYVWMNPNDIIYVEGPVRPHLRLLQTVVADALGVDNFHQWGDAEGEVMVDGLRLILLPSNKGSHRLKLECPRCHKLFGPSKWRQHAKIKH